MARDPEKRARSREADKLRKRAKRAIARLEKFAESTSDVRQRHAAKQQLTQIQSELSRSYAGSRSRTYGEQAASALASIKSRVFRTINVLRNKGVYDFREEMNKASRGKPSVLGAQGKLKNQMFWRATQNIWAGLPNSERAAAVTDALGASSLEAAFVKVMNTKEMRAALRGIGATVTDTDDISAAYEDAERLPRRIDTPTEVMMVQQIEFTKAYGA